MAQKKWFRPIETMFYDALYYYDIHNWGIEPMPSDVDTRMQALVQGVQRGWPFRTHNGRAQFRCYPCGKTWMSSFTTIIWRANWESGIVQVTIEKQGCQRCNRKCQVVRIDEDAVEMALDWLCQWILKTFYHVSMEEESDHEQNETEEPTAPHDCQRCEAGKKGTCSKCRQIQRKPRR